MSEYQELNKALQEQQQAQQGAPAAGGETAWAPGMHPLDASGMKPIGVPFKPKRKPTRYEVQRKMDTGGLAHPTWEQLEVIAASSARAALREWVEKRTKDELADDALNIILRAIPISRITQVAVAVEQRSTLKFS